MLVIRTFISSDDLFIESNSLAACSPVLSPYSLVFAASLSPSPNISRVPFFCHSTSVNARARMVLSHFVINRGHVALGHDETHLPLPSRSTVNAAGAFSPAIKNRILRLHFLLVLLISLSFRQTSYD